MTADKEKTLPAPFKDPIFYSFLQSSLYLDKFKDSKESDKLVAEEGVIVSGINFVYTETNNIRATFYYPKTESWSKYYLLTKRYEDID